LSERSLTSKIAELLERSQRKIVHLHFSWISYSPRDKSPFQQTLLPPISLQNLDIRLSCERGVNPVLKEIFTKGSSLTRLSLGEQRERSPTSLGYHLLSGIIPEGIKLRNLRHLCLHHLDLSLTFPIMTAMIDFSQLLSLSISGCDGSDSFLQELGISLTNNRASFKHIYATVSDTDCLADVLKHSDNLVSLHLIWPEGWKENFWKTIQRIGPHLESLGLHHSRTIEPISTDVRNITTLQALSSCSKLRQLGVQLSHHDLDVQAWNTHYMFKAFLVSTILRQLSLFGLSITSRNPHSGDLIHPSS